MLSNLTQRVEHCTEITADHKENRFDILRLIAAWLVLFSHSYPLGGWPNSDPLASTLGIDSFGGVGVSIFFVLSGYLVTLSLERSGNLSVFIRRRAIRIYPGLIVACLFSVLICGLFVTRLTWQDFFTHATTRDYLFSATAWKIRFSLPDVFESNPYPNAVNGSLWSLPYEIKCYIGLATLALLPGQMRLKLLGVLLFFILAALLRPAAPQENPLQAFWGFNILTNKLVFIFTLGAVLASWRNVLSPNVWLGLTLMLGAIALPPGNYQLFTFCSGLSILALWLALNGNWLPIIPKRIGDWSYGTYLYGFPVQQCLAFNGVQEHGLVIFVIASTAVTLFLAALSWHLVEKPMLRWK